MSFSSLTGLRRKPTAPASSTWLRIRSSGNAVTKMTGVRRPSAVRRSSNSTPLSPVICTSRMRQLVSSGSEFQKLLGRGKRARRMAK